MKTAAMNSATTGKSRSPFWRFSLRLYARPRVAPACLALQDVAGADVNVLFYLLFLAEQGRRIDRLEIAGIDSIVQAWRARAVVPLRTLRRELKDGIGRVTPDTSAALRTKVKRIELEAERIEQEMLERLAPAEALGTQAAARAAAASANLAAYAEFLGGLPDKPVGILLEAVAGK